MKRVIMTDMNCDFVCSELRKLIDVLESDINDHPCTIDAMDLVKIISGQLCHFMDRLGSQKVRYEFNTDKTALAPGEKYLYPELVLEVPQ